MSSNVPWRLLLLNMVIAGFFFLSAFVGGMLGLQNLQHATALTLTFHGIVAQPLYPWETTQEHLRGLIGQLKSHGFVPLSPSQFPLWRASKIGETRVFLLTFDDGLKSSAEMMRTLKREEGIDSAIFVVTDFIGKEGYLNENDLRELASDGFLIGLHGKRHLEATTILSRGENLAQELTDARKHLETITSKPVEWYAFPFGEFSPAAKSSVASAGLKMAFTIDPLENSRDSDPFQLPRIMYLKGAKEAGEPVVEDWFPPPNVKTGWLHLGMSLLVSLFGLRILSRTHKALTAIRLQEENRPAGTSPSRSSEK